MILARQVATKVEQNLIMLGWELELLADAPEVRGLDLVLAREAMQRTYSHVWACFVNDIGLLDSKGTVVPPLRAPHLTGKA